MEPTTKAKLAEIIGLSETIKTYALDALSGGYWFSHRELRLLKGHVAKLSKIINEED